MTTRPIPAIAAPFIAAAEGLVLTAYADAAGIWTVGFGHTGPQIDPGMEIDEAQARAWLDEDIATAAQRIAAKLGAAAIGALNDNQYAALLSFVFNLGTPGTTIWRDLTEGRLAEVPAQMMRFVHAGGVRLLGLMRRRAAEAELWARPIAGSPA
ncbi:MAG TPA: lysozyme [Caulobacteraceae bacterium]